MGKFSRNYRCQNCNFSDISKYKILIHRFRAHMTFEEKDSLAMFKCTDCDFREMSKKPFEAHLSSKHGLNSFKPDKTKIRRKIKAGKGKKKRANPVNIKKQVDPVGFQKQVNHVYNEGLEEIQENENMQTSFSAPRLNEMMPHFDNFQVMNPIPEPEDTIVSNESAYSSSNPLQDLPSSGNTSPASLNDSPQEQDSGINSSHFYLPTNYFEETSPSIVCQICSVKFDHQRRLFCHMLAVHEPANYKCSYCNFRSKFGGKLSNHINSKHPEVDQNRTLTEQEFDFDFMCSLAKKFEGTESMSKQKYPTSCSTYKKLERPSTVGFDALLCSLCNNSFPDGAAFESHTNFCQKDTGTNQELRAESGSQICNVVKCINCNFKTSKMTVMSIHSLNCFPSTENFFNEDETTNMELECEKESNTGGIELEPEPKITSKSVNLETTSGSLKIESEPEYNIGSIKLKLLPKTATSNFLLESKSENITGNIATCSVTSKHEPRASIRNVKFETQTQASCGIVELETQTQASCGSVELETQTQASCGIIELETQTQASCGIIELETQTQASCGIIEFETKTLGSLFSQQEKSEDISKINKLDAGILQKEKNSLEVVESLATGKRKSGCQKSKHQKKVKTLQSQTNIVPKFVEVINSIQIGAVKDQPIPVQNQSPIDQLVETNSSKFFQCAKCSQRFTQIIELALHFKNCQLV